MRHLLLALPLLLMQPPIASAQVSLELGISLPGVSIGINLPAYPEMQRVPGYPVYYAPQARANFFFYDGLYWVFEGDDWYASGWYNGPWRRVGPDAVPLYVLRVPVRYYGRPPAFFGSWSHSAPPRWGDHWGGDWSQRRQGWDRWNRRAAPPPAPLPSYQRKYPQSRYPQEAAQQQSIRSDQYRYQPRDPVVRQQQMPHAAVHPAARPAPRAAPVQHPAPARARDQPAPQPAQRRDLAPPQRPAATVPNPAHLDPSRRGQDQGRQAPARPNDGRNNDKNNDRKNEKNDKKDDRDSGGRGGR